MSDLIRREDAIEILSERAESLKGMQGDLGGACRGAMRIIEALPSAEPEWKKGKWIPVNEALPKNGQAVLCTVKGYPEGVNWTITDCRYKDGVWEACEEAAYDYWTELSDVIAWMLLPEPWSGYER